MKTILIVDPDPFARNVFGKALTRRGYQVVSYAGPLEARSGVGGRDIDVLIADTRLSTGVGDLIRGYRADGFEGPTVVLTSVLDPQEVDVDVTLILHRPLSPVELAFEIEHLVCPHSLELDDAISEGVAVESNFAEHLSHMLAELHAQVVERDFKRLAERLPEVGTEAREHGFPRVAHALMRAANAVHRVGDGIGTWQAVADALDDTFLEARTALATTAETSQFLVCTRDQELREALVTIAREHLIGIRVADPAHVAPMLASDRYDGLFIDLDLQPSIHITEFVADLRSRPSATDLPITFLSSGNRLHHRVEAAVAGATRFIEKPVSAAAFADAAQHMAALVRSGNPTVMVIVADPELAADLCQMVDAEGLNTTTSDHVDAIFELLENNDPDVLILSAEFPQISGLDICRILRSSARWSDLPILLISEHQGARTRIAAYQAGADDVLNLPLLRAELVARLRVRIDRIRLTRERADRDSLTGLLTRRAFLERVSQRMAEAKRHNRSMSLCLIDLDEFKKINDIHGHIAGDQVLAQLGRLLRERFRAEDLRCRWGGEEFAIALVDEDIVTARRVLQRVLEEFDSLTFGQANQTPFKTSFSAGISELGVDGTCFDDLLRRADERLYRAKAAGRNRIET